MLVTDLPTSLFLVTNLPHTYLASPLDKLTSRHLHCLHGTCDMHISCEEITYCLACFVSVNSIYTKLSSLTMTGFGYKVENKIFQDFLDLSVEGGRSLSRKEKRTKLEQTEILLRLLTEVCKGLSRRRLGFPAT